MSGVASFRVADALGTLARAWTAAWGVPGRRKLLFLSNPVDTTRFLEFDFLLRFLRDRELRPGRALDVSSPVMIAHMLAREGWDVLKADVNPAEAANVGGPRMRFALEDARRLTLTDDSFDLAVSISVVEHIHRDYRAAIAEMLRVVRPGGHVYVTFPVARETREEWLDEDIYAAQERDGDRVFFQYRFGPDRYREILDTLPDDAEVVREAIFWERRDGDYDRLVARIRGLRGGWQARHLKASLLNLTRGPAFFEREAAGFERARSFGNAQIILRRASTARAGSIESMSSNEPRR